MFYSNLFVCSIDFHEHFWLLFSKNAHLKGSLKKGHTDRKGSLQGNILKTFAVLLIIYL